MPDPTPAPAAPAADASAQPPVPTPPPAPPVPAPDPKNASKEMAGRLFSLLTAPTADPTAPKPAKKEEAAPPPPPPAPAAKDKKEPAEKPIVRSKKETPAEKAPVVPKPEAKAPPAPAPATPPAAKEDDAAFEAELIEEERAQLDDARDAERLLGEKFKGHGTKMLKFLRENAAKAKQVDEGKLDEADYTKWHAANLPKIGVLDVRKLNEARVEDQVNKRVTPRIEEERHARWADAETPKIKARGNEVWNKLTGTALPDDVMTAITERTKGIAPGTAEYRAKIDEVQKDYALEFEVAQNVIDVVTGDVEEFHALTTKNPTSQKPLKALNPEAEVFDPTQGKWVPNVASTNPEVARQARVLAMISKVCEDFKSTGGAALKNERGQWFATREEMGVMDAMVKRGELAQAELAKWWTFKDDQILDRALANVKTVVAESVKQRVGYLEGRGFKRTLAAPAVAAVPPVPPSPGAPPAPRPAAPPPPGAPAAPARSALASKLTSQPVPQ